MIPVLSDMQRAGVSAFAAGGGSGTNPRLLSLLDSAASAFNNNCRTRGLIASGAPFISIGTNTAPAAHTRVYTFGNAGAPFVSNGGRPTTATGRTTFPVVTPSSTRIDFAWRVDTVVDSDSVAFLLDSATANGYRFMVDGQYVSEAGSVSAAGAERYYRLQWPTKARRRVTVEGNTGLGFWGAAVPDDGQCLLPDGGDGLRMFFVGDSNPFLQGFNQKGDSYAFALGDYLGIRDTWVNAISATGFTVNGGGNTYAGRRADWTTLPADSVDLLVFQLSYNDYNAGTSNAVLQAAIETELTQARAAHPNCIIVVHGNNSWNDTAGSITGLSAHETAAAAAVAAVNDPLIQFLPIYNATGQTLPITGQSAAGNTGTGNTPRYVDHAADHMSPAGNIYFGQWLGRRMVDLFASMAGVPAPQLDLPEAKQTRRTRERFRASTDCVANTAGNYFSYQVSGTGAAFSSVAPGADNASGIMRAALGTVATNRAAIAAANFALFRFGLGPTDFVSKFRVVTLSDGTNTYSLRGGYIDSVTGESTDGAFLRYTHSVNGGRFQAVTRNNNTETAIDTGVTVAANVWYKTDVVVNAAGTRVEFWINEQLVAVSTTNIPTASGRETSYGIMALRSVGTAAVNCFDCDFIDVVYDFTTAR